MKAAIFNDLEARLQEIDVQITELPLENDFKQIIQEDLNLTKSYINDRNVLGVINCLLVIVGKLHSHILAAHCPCTTFEPLLICIHRLLQILIKLPINVVGPTGATGPKGATGPAGCDGAVGATGATGPIGPEGKPGPKGATGATGPAGKDGAVGATGATGPIGPEGKPGPKGATGAIGPAGKDGAVGATGATGPAGCDGAVGVTGAIGPIGPMGPPGPEGSMGPTGPAGTTHMISSCTIPVCDFSVECKEPVKTQCFDDGIHYEFVCKPKNPFHK